MTSIRKRLVIWLLLGLSIMWVAAGAGVYYSVQQGELARLDARLAKLDNSIRLVTNILPRHMLSDDIKPPPKASDRGESPARDQRSQLVERALRDDSRSRALTERLENLSRENGCQFHIWKPDGTTILKSPNLDETNIEKPDNLKPGSPSFFDISGKNGKQMRAMAIMFRPKGFGFPRLRGNDPTGRRPGSPPPQNIPVRRPGGHPPQDAPRFHHLTAIVTTDADPMHQTMANLLLGITGIGILAALGSVTLIQLALKSGLKPLNTLGSKVALIDASSLDGRFSSENMPRELTPICNHLNELMERLEESFEREKRFSSDLAHELRTPIAELRMMSEVAMRWPDQNNSDQAKETLEIAEQMQAIIESLLTLGRYENRQTEIQPESVDISSLCRSCWKPFSARAAEKEIRVNLDIPETQTLETDPKLLRLILNNLFSNASEYTPAGGVIDITGAGELNGIILSVSNTVSDIEPESIHHLFERFWRQDDARSDNNHSGLGLCLARTCSRALSLDIQAELDQENRIIFNLKRADEEKKLPSSSGNIV